MSRNYTEKKREYWRGYYQKNKEEIKERARERNKTAEKKQYYRNYYLKNRERKLTLAKEWALKFKGEILSYYGNGKLACVKCGFTDIRALSIDHIKGGGLKQTRQLGISSGRAFWLWLRRNNYPEGYQTLCMNCQFIKRVEYDYKR